MGRRDGQPKDIVDRRFAHSYLRLVGPESELSQKDLLPAVSVITALNVCGSQDRYIWPASCSAIAASLPRLQTFSPCLWDNEKKNLDEREGPVTVRFIFHNLIICVGNVIVLSVIQRLLSFKSLVLFTLLDFAHSLALLPSSVEEVCLLYHNTIPQDETFSPPSLVTIPGDEDLLSMNLRKFSQQLTVFCVNTAVVGSEIFWLFASCESTKSLHSQPPYWPRITSFQVNYVPVTPSGQWLFERDPDAEVDTPEEPQDYRLYMSEDEVPPPEDWRDDRFRTKASPQLMNAFYVAAGRAVAHMPCLRYMFLCNSYCASLGEHWFKYTVTGTRAIATWGSTPSFRPNDQVLEAWRATARKHTDTELEVNLREGYHPWDHKYF